MRLMRVPPTPVPAIGGCAQSHATPEGFAAEAAITGYNLEELRRLLHEESLQRGHI